MAGDGDGRALLSLTRTTVTLVLLASQEVPQPALVHGADLVPDLARVAALANAGRAVDEDFDHLRAEVPVGHCVRDHGHDQDVRVGAGLLHGVAHVGVESDYGDVVAIGHPHHPLVREDHVEALLHERQHVREAELRQEVRDARHGDPHLHLLRNGPGEEPGADTMAGVGVPRPHAHEGHALRPAPEACPSADVQPGEAQGREHGDLTGLRQELLRDPLELPVGVTELRLQGSRRDLIGVELVRDLVDHDLHPVLGDGSGLVLHDRQDRLSHAHRA